MPSCHQWEVAHQAALLTGATVVGIDADDSIVETDWALAHAEVTWMIASAESLVHVSNRAKERLTRLIVVGDPSEAVEARTLTWQRSGEFSAGVDADALAAQRQPDDVATILYTSGTTGTPKGIAVTHRQLMIACQAIAEALPELGDQDTTICWLPLHALFQRIVNLVAMLRGMKTWFVQDSRRILESIREIRPSFMIGVPRTYEKLDRALREMEGGSGADWRQTIKFMISGSAPLPSAIQQSLCAQGLLVLQAYGVTENTVPIAMNRATDFRFGSVGKTLPQNEVRLEADGEILVRGAGVFQGYFREEPASSLFTADGFYRTGDYGYRDDDGFLYLTGRKADIIKTSTGRRISPLAVEAVYSQSPFVQTLVVFGDAQKYLVGLLAVDSVRVARYLAARGLPADVHEPEATVAIKRLIQSEFRRLEHQLAPFERIQALGILAEPLTENRREITSSGKPRRKAIATNHQPLLDQLFQVPPPCVLADWERVPLQTVGGAR